MILNSWPNDLEFLSTSWPQDHDYSHLSLRIGFELRVCQPYRAQTKGKVESGVKYVRGNLWPSVRFTDDADLNRQTLEWCDSVANRRVHGTMGRRPWEMLAEERVSGSNLSRR